MIRLLLIVLIVVFVASQLDQSTEQTTTATPPASSTGPTAARTPTRTATPKPTITPPSGSRSAGAPAPPLDQTAPKSDALLKIATGLTGVLAGVGELTHAVTTVMVDDGDDGTHAALGAIVLVWTVLGGIGISILRGIGRFLGGLFG
ncbi:MAG: hypothetical protein HY868_25320 [Chloroflexi bacterium]|nr:hypothetical protein [Chloroflexota bacterium]